MLMLTDKGSLHVSRKDDVEGLDLATALELLKWPVVLGDAPSGEAVLLARGKYGFYVQQGQLRASVQKVCLLSSGMTQRTLQYTTPSSTKQCTTQHNVQHHALHKRLCELQLTMVSLFHAW